MTQGRKGVANTPPLEWIAAAVGLALILLVGGMIAREALDRQEAALPAIQVRPLRVEIGRAGFVVEFEAVNLSGGTAAAVAIEGKAGDETSTATLDYVPGHGRVKGGLFFSKQDPRAGLGLRATGFQTP
ncbi:hypothetical protein [Sphingomonas sp.]|jgi:uncharacterized protein (TIGR02588 family)|uniref:hypothetical protein n=1 Tax=Sphingomonas sp. TaxID=28214 RepID=UPI002ED84C35